MFIEEQTFSDQSTDKQSYVEVKKTRKGQERGKIINSGALKDEGTKNKTVLENWRIGQT